LVEAIRRRTARRAPPRLHRPGAGRIPARRDRPRLRAGAGQGRPDRRRRGAAAAVGERIAIADGAGGVASWRAGHWPGWVGGRGLERAAGFTPEAWAERFAERVDSVLHRDPAEQEYRIEVSPWGGERGFRLAPGRAKLKLQLQNTGGVPLLNDGACETRIW